MVFNTLFSFLTIFSIPNTSKIQFFAHTQQNDVYSFPRVAPNCKLRKNFTVDAGAVLHGCSSIYPVGVHLYVCDLREKKREMLSISSDGWKTDTNRDDFEKNTRERESERNDVQNFLLPVVRFGKYAHIHSHTVYHRHCARVCVLV